MTLVMNHWIVLPIVHTVAALVLSPLLIGVINRTKALFGGRKGQPFLQPYHDLARLLRKGAVYSRTTSYLFRLGPVVGLAGAVAALLLMPFGSVSAPIFFTGDFLLLVYVLGLMRLFLVLAALDTGSAFEGMGASREAFFSIFAEIALLVGLAAIAKSSGSLSLSGMFVGLSVESWKQSAAVLGLVSMDWLAVFLAENARIPVDDPNTHLELTMIHEVMVLDHSGPDFGLIQYAAAVKLWVLGALLVHVVVPFHSRNVWADELAFMAGMLGLAVLVGVIESVMARLRLLFVPRFLVGASAFSVLALFLVLR